MISVDVGGLSGRGVCRVFRIMRFKAMIWVLSGRDAGSATVSGVALRLLVSTAPKLISNYVWVCM